MRQLPQQSLPNEGNIMTRTPKADLLIARWNHNQDLITDRPHQTIWANGVAATYQEYLDYMTDTHTWISGPNGMELHIFPRIVADVRYDHIAGTWVLDGVGPTRVALDVTDPSAPDDQITAELYTHLVVYKARIHR